MKSSEILQTIKYQKLFLTKSEKINLWSNYFLMCFFIVVFNFVLIQVFIDSQSIFILESGVVILLLFLLFLKINSRTNVRTFKIKLTPEQFKEANKAVSLLNGWHIITNKKDYFRAIYQTIYTHDGFMITTINKDNNVYINGMMTPSLRAFPFSLGVNNKNITTLVSQYIQAEKGEDVIAKTTQIIKQREEHFWKSSEWTLYLTFKRIILSFFSLLFIVFSILINVIDLSLLSLFFGIGLMIPSLLYLLSDWKIIRIKSKN